MVSLATSVFALVCSVVTCLPVQKSARNLATEDLGITVSYDTAEFVKQAQIATSLATLLSSIEESVTPRTLKKMVESSLLMDPAVYGSCIAFEPDSYPWSAGGINTSPADLLEGVPSSDGTGLWGAASTPWTLPQTELWPGENSVLYAPYAYRGGDWSPGQPFKYLDVADGYNYYDASTEWYHDSRTKLLLGNFNFTQGAWTKPYFDAGAGNVQMVTYSVPFWRRTPVPMKHFPGQDDPSSAPYGLPDQRVLYNRDGEPTYFWGIATVDLVLDALTFNCGNFSVFDKSSKSCVACPSGKMWRAVEGSPPYCELCAKGQSSMGGNTTCQLCEFGTYQPNEGASSCLGCDYILPGSSTTSTMSISPDDCTCKQGTYFRRENPSDKGLCDSCPEGLSCLGGLKEPLQMAGYQVSKPSFSGQAPSYIVKCSDPVVCPADLPMGGCPEHREGLACSVCEVNYVRGGSQGACKLCPNDQTSLPVLFTVCGVILASVVLWRYSTQDLGVASTSLITLAVTLSISFNVLQVLGAFRELDLEWPEPLRSILPALKLLAFDAEFLNPGCAFRTNSIGMTYWGSLMAYPCFAVCVTLVFCIASLIPRPWGRPLNRDNLFNAQGLALMIFYISLNIVALLPWQCARNPDGSFSVASRRGVLCWTGEHTTMLVGSVFGIVFFVLGFLTTVAWATIQYPSRLRSAGCINFLRRYNFLFSRYKVERYYYGVVYSVRNLVIASIPIILVNSFILQMMAMSFALVCGLAMQAWLQPWKPPLCNYVDASVSVSLLMFLVGGTMVSDVDGKEARKLLTYLFAVTLLAVLALVVVVILIAIKGFLLKNKPYFFFLCHHKVGGGALARWFKLLLKGRTSGDVFLDSDNLDRLDKLFEYVGHQTRHFVPLLTRETLSRIWCAGEVATAMKLKVKTFRVKCDDYTEVSDDFILSLGDIWDESQIGEVGRLGVPLESIQWAYELFRNQESCELNRRGPLEEQLAVVKLVLDTCTSSVLRYASAQFSLQSSPAEETRVLIIGQYKDVEAATTCRILQMMIQQQMHQGVWVFDDTSSDKFDARCTACKACTFVLTRGLIDDFDFAKLAIEVVKLHHLSKLPIIADVNFAFPNAAFYKDLEMRKDAPEGIEEAYGTLFSILALRITPNGSQTIIDAEFLQIRARLSEQPTKVQSTRAVRDALSSNIAMSSVKRRQNLEATSQNMSLPMTAEQESIFYAGEV